MKIIDEKLVYKTDDNTYIYVSRGEKSLNDFIVRYKQLGKSRRTPKHVHLLIDLLIKKCLDRELTLKFVKKLFDTLEIIAPTKSYPPNFQCFNKDDFKVYNKLNNYCLLYTSRCV